jgi:hypothetical protein
MRRKLFDLKNPDHPMMTVLYSSEKIEKNLKEYKF